MTDQTIHPSAGRWGKLRTVARWYTTAAILLLNTLVLLVIVNIAAWMAILGWRWLRAPDARTEHLHTENLRKAYPAMTDAERTALLTESVNRPLMFEQFVHFKERPYQGKYVNVSENGYRISTSQGPWPLDPANYNIFVFGGSTTFGYGVADHQTIPAQLQRFFATSGGHAGKPVCVYNFGCGFYSSTPERILFEQMLQKGIKPDLALFIDGLNDFYWADGSFAFTIELTRAMEALDKAGRLRGDFLNLVRASPMGEVIARFAKRPKSTWDIRENDPALHPAVIDRYLWNKKIIELVAREEGVAVVFVFQPSPTYGYDLSAHLFRGDDEHWAKIDNCFGGYPLMAKYVAENPMGEDFLWLGDMQRGVRKPLYCDRVHYNAEFSGDIAARIGKFILFKKIQ